MRFASNIFTILPGLNFQTIPKYFGQKNTTTIREQHGKNLTVSVGNLSNFWS